MSDTPRVDAKKRGDFVHIDVALELERELNAANAELAQLREDKERLDWMDARATGIQYFAGFRLARLTDGDSARDVIDDPRRWDP